MSERSLVTTLDGSLYMFFLIYIMSTSSCAVKCVRSPPIIEIVICHASN